MHARLNDSEWVLLRALWQGAPASVRTIWERTHEETGWAYTTVKTLLERLVEKGAVKSSKAGNAWLYQPLVSRKSARHQALRALLTRAFDGTLGSLVHHMVHEERLSPRDRRALREILRSEGAEGDAQ